MEFFGGGKIGLIKISASRGKISEVSARLGIFGSQLAVIKQGRRDGMIGIPYWNNQLAHEILSKEVRRRRAKHYSTDILLYQIYPDLYSALRRTLHILYGNYGRSFKDKGEKKAIQEALKKLTKINQLYLSLSKKNEDYLAGEIESLAMPIIRDVVQRPASGTKKQVKILLDQASKVYDSLNRLNPSAKLVQLVAAKKRLEGRVVEILSIEPKVVAQRQSLISIIELCELRFSALEDFLARLLPNLSQRFFDLHGGDHLAKKVIFRLQALARDVSIIDLRPFSFTSSKIELEISQAAGCILSNDFCQAGKLLNRSFNSLKLRSLRSDLERLITRLTKHLFQPDKKLSAAEIKRIKKDLLVLRRRLGSVDEFGFKQPVCKPALSLVSQAEQEIKYRVEAKNIALKPVKEKLVLAARLL